MDSQSEFFDTDEWEILTEDGFKSFSGVMVTSNVDTIVIKTTTQSIRCSENHLFKMHDSSWLDSASLSIGDELFGGEVVVSKNSDVKTTVYDPIGVKDTQSYLIGNITSHNCDEYAFIPNTQADEFFTAVYPTITAGKDTKVFMTSTPNGYNHFHKFWVEAHKTEKEWNGFTPVRVHWYETPGRDRKWYDEQKAILGELKAAQEIDAEFLGSSKTLLNGSTLARLTHDIPIKEYTDQYKGMKVYAQPEKGHVYSISVDVSRGRHLDNSAFIVFDITTYPHRIAATYKNSEIPPMLYASLIQKVGLVYNTAYLLIEINDVGAQVADTLWHDLEYSEMHWTKSGDILGKQGADPYPGIRTTKKTKRIGCANLSDMVNNNQLIINDFDLIHELSTFIQSASGSYEADEGFHDDLVMCCVLHSWLTSQRWFGDLTDSNLRETMHNTHVKELEDQICLAAFYSDGVDEAENPGAVMEDHRMFSWADQ